MARQALCHPDSEDPNCPRCKARIAMREKRAKEKNPDVDSDLMYLNELIERARDRGTREDKGKG